MLLIGLTSIAYFYTFGEIFLTSASYHCLADNMGKEEVMTTCAEMDIVLSSWMSTLTKLDREDQAIRVTTSCNLLKLDDLKKV